MEKRLLTKEEEGYFEGQLEKCIENYDTEVAHGDADSVLEEILDTMGYINLTYLYNQVKKWYA